MPHIILWVICSLVPPFHPLAFLFVFLLAEAKGFVKESSIPLKRYLVDADREEPGSIIRYLLHASLRSDVLNFITLRYALANNLCCYEIL